MASSKLYLWIAMLMLSLYTTSSAPDLSGVGCSPKLDGYPGCEELELNSTIHFSFSRDIPSLSVLFVASPPTPKGWTAWGINLNGSGMIGAEVLAAFRSNNIITVNTYRLIAHNYVIAAKLSLELWDARAEEIGDIFKIYATIRIPTNMKSLNHTWNTGPSVTEKGELEIHPLDTPHKTSKGELILSEGIACAVRDGAIKVYKITNPLGWTILFFSGLVVTKLIDIYPSVNPKRWYFLQMICQLSGWAAGALHSGTGIMLDLDSVQFVAHRQLGAAVFFLATFVLIIELYAIPDRDNKNKSYCNLYFYHNKFAYVVMVIGAVHAFRGFEVFPHEEIWKSGYSVMIGFLFGMALLLEVLTCTTRKR